MRQARSGRGRRFPSRLAVLAIVLAVACYTAAAQESESKGGFRKNTGIGIWTESLSRTTDIAGGTYLTAGFEAFLGDFALLDIRYLTDIVPAAFSDHLVAASLGFKAINFGQSPTTASLEGELGIGENSNGPAFVLAPTYLVQLAGGTLRHYAGVTISPLHFWKLGFSEGAPGLVLDLLAVRLLLDVVDYEFLWGFSAVNLAIF